VLALLALLSAACSTGAPGGSLAFTTRAGPVALPPAHAEGLPVLAVGSRVEGEIGGTDVQEYRLDLPAAAYARVTVEQRSDVALELRDPDGSVVARSDGPGGHHPPEQLSWITVAAGSYRLLVSAHDPQASRGSYALNVDELRPAVAGDEQLVAMERDAAEAYQRGFNPKAEDKRQAVAVLQRVLAAWWAAGDRRREAQTLNDIGNLQINQGDNTEAIGSLQAALDLARSLDLRREQARACGQLGRVLRRTGEDKVRILGLYHESLRLWRDLGDLTGEADALFNVGVLYADDGDPETALSFYEQALKVQDAAGLLAPEAFTLAAIGLIARDKGDASRALDCFTRGLELARRSGDRSAETYLLYSTASFHLRRGELQRAIELFTQALNLYREQGDLSQEARSLMSLGSTNVYLGDYDRASECYRQALNLHREAHDSSGEQLALVYLGLVLQLRGDTDEALESYTKALALARESGQVQLARVLYYLGRADVSLGRPAEAVPLLEEALKLNERMKSTLGTALTLIELGNAAHALGDDQRSSDHLRKALELGHSLQNFVVENTALSAIAHLERDRGNLPAARGAIEEALRLVDSMRSKVASQRLRVSFFASHQAYYGTYLDILMRQHEVAPETNDLATAFAASERARARGLLDLLAEGRIDVRRGIDPDLKQREDEIDSRISALQSQMLDDLSARAWDASKAESLRAALQRAAEDREELDWEIRRRNPRYAAVRDPKPLQLADVQRLLDRRTALLEYAAGETRSFLFVVTAEGLTSYVLPPVAQLTDEVRRLGTALQKPGRRNFGLYAGLARKLYQEIISPAAEALAAKDHLIIAPDGPLYSLSFEALLTRDPAQDQRFADLPFLIWEKSVSYVPSAGVLAELEQPWVRPPAAVPPLRFVGFADPEVAVTAKMVPSTALRSGSLAAELPGLGRLAQSRREVTDIASLYKPDESRLYLGSEATEENVKNTERLRNARRIHFATHGLLDATKPELSGLLLSRGPGSREDGLLQVYEIFNLQLDADLVVLSACETGAGVMVSGEGLVGVTRALLYAGARSVVVSLWQIDDASTPGLMLSFYRHLDQDADKAEALRLAKLEMIRQGTFAHPFYWAPFILIGKPQ
jgi:CHAT domain-containing protein/Tfp pilus assembly protein PilF